VLCAPILFWTECSKRCDCIICRNSVNLQGLQTDTWVVTAIQDNSVFQSKDVHNINCHNITDLFKWNSLGDCSVQRSKTIKNSPHGPWDKYPIATPSNRTTLVVQHYILHEHAKHSPDRMWMPSGFHTSNVHRWWFQSPSTLSKQRTFDSSWTKMPRLKWYSHYSSNLQSYSWRWYISWSIGWMTASMPMGTI